MSSIDVSSVVEVSGMKLNHKHLVDDVTWERLVNRIVEDEKIDRSLAERIMDQALGFLALVKLEPESHYGPSALVDIGWHTFILYTKPYAAFCQDLAGHFIHHDPTDVPGVDYSEGNTPSDTVTAMARHGLVVDEALWAHLHANDCTASDGDGDQSCQTGPCTY